MTRLLRARSIATTALAATAGAQLQSFDRVRAWVRLAPYGRQQYLELKEVQCDLNRLRVAGQPGAVMYTVALQLPAGVAVLQHVQRGSCFPPEAARSCPMPVAGMISAPGGARYAEFTGVFRNCLYF